MYRQEEHRKELIYRISIYALMILFSVTALIFLVFHMLGYTFNPDTRELQQTGLVQYNSYPSGSMVFVDGMQLRRAQTKNTVLPGKHTFSMELDGYESWRKTIDIKSNTVTNLNYARLIPSKRSTSEVQTLSNMQTAHLSPAGNFMMAFGHKDNAPVATLGDLRDTNKEKFTEHAINTSILAGYNVQSQYHSFEVVEWDRSTRFLLVKHTYQNESGTRTVQWLRFDRETPTDPVDITALTRFAITKAHFIGTTGAELYVLRDTGELHRLDLSAQAVYRPDIVDVQTFLLYGDDRIAYVATQSGKKIAGVWKKGWQKPLVINTFDNSATPIVRVSSYFHKDTVALAAGNVLTFYRGEISDDTEAQEKFLETKKTISLNYAASGLSFNNSGRFITVRGSAAAQSYDLERSSLSEEFRLGAGQEIRWLDDFYLWDVTSSGKLAIREFDGTNLHELLPANKTLTAALSSNQRYVYSLTQNDSGHLVLNKMNMTTGVSNGWFN